MLAAEVPVRARSQRAEQPATRPSAPHPTRPPPDPGARGRRRRLGLAARARHGRDGARGAAISTAFGVLLLSATGYIGAWLAADPTFGDSDIATLVIGVLSVLLAGVAVYVASIVTANTFATIIAGRTRAASR